MRHAMHVSRRAAAGSIRQGEDAVAKRGEREGHEEYVFTSIVYKGKYSLLMLHVVRLSQA